MSIAVFQSLYGWFLYMPSMFNSGSHEMRARARACVCVCVCVNRHEVEAHCLKGPAGEMLLLTHHDVTRYVNAELEVKRVSCTMNTHTHTHTHADSVTHARTHHGNS